MTLTGTFFLKKEKIEFLFAMKEFGKKNIYLKYKDKTFDLRYLINVFKTEKFFLAILNCNINCDILPNFLKN